MPTSDINVVLAVMIIGSFLVSIMIHECGHALVASWLGDPTPRREGRLSFNLLAHLDPVGMLLALILAFLPVGAGPVGLGWGKPVKSDPWKLRGGPNVGTLFVALGGIVTSLVVGAVFAVVLRFVLPFIPNNMIAIRVPQLITVFASVNISLAIFNIIPLYPLDGYQILYTLLPSRQAVQFARSAPYGPFIILALLFLLPFLGQLSGLGGFFLFHIPYYILQGALNLIALVTGLPPLLINELYIL
jgi:Zn-dependent protease